MYAKIFSQIFDSSIVENPEVRFTFMDLLVLADMNGVVDMTHEAIARRTNRPLDLIRETILVLEQPDSRSRTPDAHGARLAKLDKHRDWGWMILNYDRFREIASEEQKRAKTLIRVRKYRSKSRVNNKCNAPVTHANASNAMQKQKQKQKKGGEEIPPSLRKAISPAERITLEKEKKELQDKLSKMGQAMSREESDRKKYLRERLSKVESAIFIPLP